MKIHYLGTAAAEGIPGLFCNCPVCTEAREKGGRYIRMRSQLMLDNELLVDFGPDTYANTLRCGYNLADLKNVLITHAHQDHLYSEDFANRINGFAHGMKYPTLEVYGSSGVTEMIMSVEPAARVISRDRVHLTQIKPYEKVQIGSFTVIPLPANHGTKEPFVYLIQRDGKTFFMHNDSGYLKEEVWEWLKSSGIKCDLISYDCTFGDTETDYTTSHLGIPMALRTRARLTEIGVATADTLHIVTHFSHNGGSVGYGDMKKVAESNGFLLAYDGYEIEI